MITSGCAEYDFGIRVGATGKDIVPPIDFGKKLEPYGKTLMIERP